MPDKTGNLGEDGDFEIPAMMDDRAMKLVRKGEEINLTRLDPGIRDITIGIGWDLKKFEGDPIDLDGSLFLLDKN